MRRGQDETSYIISCDTAWTFNRRGYWASFLFAVFFFFFWGNHVKPKSYRARSIPTSRGGTLLSCDGGIPSGWRLTTKKERQGKTVEEGTNESTAATAATQVQSPLRALSRVRLPARVFWSKAERHWRSTPHSKYRTCGWCTQPLEAAAAATFLLLNIVDEKRRSVRVSLFPLSTIYQ